VDGGTIEVEGIIDMQTSRIENLGTPVNQNDAVSLSYLEGNYLTSTDTETFVNQEINGLASIYYP
jgi:hypothetical protein